MINRNLLTIASAHCIKKKCIQEMNIRRYEVAVTSISLVKGSSFRELPLSLQKRASGNFKEQLNENRTKGYSYFQIYKFPLILHFHFSCDM